MAKKQHELAEAVLQDPAVGSLSSFIGADGTNTTLNSGRMSINLKPLSERKVGAADVIRRLKERVSDVQSIELYMQPVQNITVDDRVSRTQYQYTLEGSDPDELSRITKNFVSALKELSELEDVTADQQPGGRAISLEIDRATASRLGVTLSSIDNTLYDAFGQRQIGTMYTQLNQYHVILEATPEFQRHPRALQELYVPTSSSTSAAVGGSSYASFSSSSAGSNATTTAVAYTPSSGALSAVPNALTPSPPTTTTSSSTNVVPLDAIATIKATNEPLSINHQGQFPAVTVSFNLAPGASLGQAISAIERVAKELNFPPSIDASFQGSAAAFKNALSNEALLILAALVTVYLVLGMLYESFIHPVTILSTLFSAGVGALLALMIFGQELSVVAIIGIILLIGIVKKNGILMVDFALEAEREHGKSPTDAIYEACLLRFRPIMMTTMAALLGGLPLALSSGIGSELRRPLGIAMVGGLILSQVMTLYTTPVIYIFFDRLAPRRAPTSPPTAQP
jgi:multidrug efflux pump